MMVLSFKETPTLSAPVLSTLPCMIGVPKSALTDLPFVITWATGHCFDMCDRFGSLVSREHRIVQSQLRTGPQTAIR